MTLKDALAKGRVVVVAGSGISKEPPSNLPSWWGYNIQLVEGIGEVAKDALKLDKNPLDAEKIVNALNVTVVSDYLTNRIANKAYYPLLSLLNSSRPNVNHYSLARLAKDKKIKAVVTTNFDTLLENACREEAVLFRSLDKPSEFIEKEGFDFPIYKIHGSATNTEFAIDTVTQKLKGLSPEKKYILQKLFAENHIVFLGFSGEDFAFGSDYIPVHACKEGLTWIAHPGSKFNARTKKIIDELNIDVQVESLTCFFNKIGLSPKAVPVNDEDLVPFNVRARERIQELLMQPFIGGYSCVGMSIELLDFINEREQASNLVEKALSKKPRSILELPSYCVLMTHAALHYRTMGQYEESERICLGELKNLYVFNDELPPVTKAQVRERAFNESTVLCNLAVSCIHKTDPDYAAAFSWATKAFLVAYRAHHWENMAVAMNMVALCQLLMTTEDLPMEERVRRTVIRMFVSEGALSIAAYAGIAREMVVAAHRLALWCASFRDDNGFKHYYDIVMSVIDVAIVDRDWITNSLNEAKRALDSVNGNRIDFIGVLMEYERQDNWKGQRPLLCYKEGKQAKNLYDDKGIDAAIRYMEDTIPELIKNNSLDIADALSDACHCLVVAKLQQIEGDDTEGETIKLYEKLNMHLKRQFEMEVEMGRFDRAAQTLSSIAESSSKNEMCDREQILFDAELAIYMGVDSRYNWGMAGAAKSAAELLYNDGCFAEAKEYCNIFFDAVLKNKNAAYPNEIMQMQLLSQMVDYSIENNPHD